MHPRVIDSRCPRRYGSPAERQPPAPPFPWGVPYLQQRQRPVRPKQVRIRLGASGQLRFRRECVCACRDANTSASSHAHGLPSTAYTLEEPSNYPGQLAHPLLQPVRPSSRRWEAVHPPPPPFCSLSLHATPGSDVSIGPASLLHRTNMQLTWDKWPPTQCRTVRRRGWGSGSSRRRIRLSRGYSHPVWTGRPATLVFAFSVWAFPAAQALRRLGTKRWPCSPGEI